MALLKMNRALFACAVLLALSLANGAQAQHTCPFARPAYTTSPQCASGFAEASVLAAVDCRKRTQCRNIQTNELCVAESNQPDCSGSNTCRFRSLNLTTCACPWSYASSGTACTRSGSLPGFCDGTTNTCRACLSNGQCNDGNSCTTDACTSFNCAYTANTGNACGSGGICGSTGACVTSQCSSCSPTNQCFTSACDASTNFQCTQTYRGDGTSCTVSSMQGACRSTPSRACYATQCWPPGSACASDSNPCTSDACSSIGTCPYSTVAANSVCTTSGGNPGYCDGNFCRTSECTVAMQAVNCNDGNQCTTDICTLRNAQAGLCSRTTLPNNSPCGAGQESCQAGVCTQPPCSPATQAVDCDDGNPCTADTCEGSPLLCVNTPVSSSPVPPTPNCAQTGVGAPNGYCSGGASPVCTECINSSHCPLGQCCVLLDVNTGQRDCRACDSCLSTTTPPGMCEPPPGLTGVDGDSIFRMIPEGETAYDPIEIGYQVRSADVYFLMDTTSSMQGELNNLRSSLTATQYTPSCAPSCTNPGIIGSIRCCVNSAWFGIGTFDDFRVNPFGVNWNTRTYYSGNTATGDRTFWNRISITDPALPSSSVPIFAPAVRSITGTGTARITEAAASIILGQGSSVPESQLSALFMIAAGTNPWSAQSASAGSAWVNPQFSGQIGSGTYCDSDDYWGYPCFRTGNIPIVVMMTDAPFHGGPALDSFHPLASTFPVLSNTTLYNANIPYGSLGGGIAAPPTFATAVNSMVSREMRTLIVESSDGRSCTNDADCTGTPAGCQAYPADFQPRCVNAVCRGPGYAHALALANATGSVDAAFTPYVTSINCDGTGLGGSVVNQVATLAQQERIDISVAAVGAPAGLAVTAVPVSANPAVNCDPPSGGVFPRCLPGTQVNYSIRIANVGIPQAAIAQVFNFRLELRGGSSRLLQSIPVRIVVPPPQSLYPVEGRYWHDYDSLSTCSNNERPEWGRLQWDATFPTGTSVQFELRTADTVASLDTATPTLVPSIDATTDVDNNGFGDQIGEISVGSYLRSAGVPYTYRYIRVTAVLRPNSSRTRSPTLRNFDLQYTCIPAE